MNRRKYRAFLLLGFKSPIPGIKPSPSGRITFPKLFDKKKPYFNILILKEFDDPPFFQGMLEIAAPKNKTLTLREAMDIAHFYQSTRLIYYFCIFKDYKESSLLPLGEKILSTTPPWSLDDLTHLNREEIGHYYTLMEVFKIDFKTYTGESMDDFKNCMPLLARCINDKNFSLAGSYLYKSITDLGVDVCDWRERYFDKNYDRFASDSDRESAFLNACKAIEAICGDFGSNKKTYSNRLKRVGIDPTELCGYREKEPLLNKVSRYLSLRDKLSAHGSGRKRRLKISEVIDFQSVARSILLNSEKTYKLKKE